jgi:DNA-binding LytR/AlgR family response regulator
MMVLSIVVLLALIGVVFYHRVNLTLSSLILLAYTAAMGAIGLWTFWMLLPLAIILLPLNVTSLRRSLLSAPALRAFRKVMPQSFVIFTTAYDEYAMEAIKNNGLDYLMKPIDADELRAAIGKLRLNRNAQQSAVVSPLHDVLNDTRQYRERFLITKGDELCMLCVDDISYINMRDNRITAFTVDGTSYPLPMSMNDLEQALDPDRFFRLNRQYIANIKGIRKISFYFGSKLMVKLKGCEDDNIVISKEKATLFKKWLEK